MKVVICGAGQVGFNIAQYLAGENNDVTVIDQRPELIRKMNNTLDVQTFVGHASHPPVLEQAGVEAADVLIAVTQSDEVNMMACQVAHSLFDVPTKIARIRSQSYLQPIWAHLFNHDHLPIDVIISPEIEVARAISRRLEVPGAIDVIPLAGGKVRMIAVRCLDDCPLLNTPLWQLTVLFPDLNIVIIGIVRDGKAIIPTSQSHMQTGDEVYFVTDARHIRRSMAAFGYDEQEARRLLVFGGGNIGLFLAQKIEKEHPSVSLKVIEKDQERAELIARSLQETIVLNGDVLDLEILEESSIGLTETVIAVTNDDEINILSSLLAKRFGCKRAMTLINTRNYDSLIGGLGIDVVVNPRSITVSGILQHVRRGKIRAVHSLGEGFGELIEADALETSSLVGKPLKETNLPEGVLVGAIVRGDQVISPRGNTVVQVNDRVVMFATPDSVKKVEKLFSVRLEFF